MVPPTWRRKKPCSSRLMEAKDPAVDSVQTFQTRVSEGGYGRLVLHCQVARPYGETMTSDIGDEIKRKFPHREINYFLLSELKPKMPPENPFQHTKRFYVLNKSELIDNDDCIRLYLELAIATTNRDSDPDLSNLEILEVALESTAIEPTPPSEGLRNGNDAIFYIRYKHSPKSQVKKDVDRVAIVRRICDEQTGSFSLLGEIKSSLTIPKKVMSRRAAVLFKGRLGVYKPWRLSNPRLHAFKNRIFGLAPLRLSTV